MHVINVRKGDEQMKKRTYIKPRVVGSADVHPCWCMEKGARCQASRPLT